MKAEIMKSYFLAAALLALSSPAFAQPAAPPASQRTPIATYCWSESAGAEVECGASGTGASGAAITPVVTTVAANSLVIKASAGSLFSVYATGLTGGSTGWLLVLNLAAKPADGAVAPLIAIPFSGGVASASYAGLPPAAFATGITVVVSSAASPYTLTTGVLTAAFISGFAR